MAKKSRGIQSIEVGGELLRALARSGEPMMLRDLAREAGMAPAKAHPYLVSFSRIGLIEQDETNGRYEIGALALELGLISLRRLSAVRIAAPRIAALASEIDHAVSLAVWGTHGPTVVRLEEPSSSGAHRHAGRFGDGDAGNGDRPCLHGVSATEDRECSA